MAASKVAVDSGPMNEDEYPTTFDDNKQPATQSYQPPVQHDDEHYNMTHKHRGKIIIFNHEKFDDRSLKERTGTQVDLLRLRDKFKKLGFKVIPHQDAKAAEIQEFLIEESRNAEFNKNSDCLIVAVMTHGDENGILHARDNDYRVETLWEKFTAIACPELAGKPKIFLIQACRGKETTSMMAFEEGLGASVETDGQAAIGNLTRYSIPCEADILIAYSTFPGRVAYRVTDDGSWFIQDLCRQLDETAMNDDLLSILTRVNRQVAIYREHENHKQMPMIQSTLTRKICFGSCQKIQVDGVPFDIIERLRDMLDTSQNVSTKRKPATKKRAEFEELQPTYHCFTIPSNDEQLLTFSKALKLFIISQSNEGIREEGQTILHLMANWKNLSYETQCFAYCKLVDFLKTRAKDWPSMELVTLPDLRSRRKSSSSARETTDGLRYGTPRRSLTSSKKA